MPKLLKAELRSLFHDYKKRVFELEHDVQQVDQRRDTVRRFVTEVLDEKAHYHFHQKVDKQHADTLDLIYDFSREALLPPIVSRLAERVALLEARQQAWIDMVHRALDILAEDQN